MNPLNRLTRTQKQANLPACRRYSVYPTLLRAEGRLKVGGRQELSLGSYTNTHVQESLNGFEALKSVAAGLRR